MSTPADGKQSPARRGFVPGLSKFGESPLNLTDLQNALLAQIELGGDEIWFEEAWTPEPVQRAQPVFAAPRAPLPEPEKQSIAGFADLTPTKPIPVQLQDYSGAEDLKSLYEKIRAGQPYQSFPQSPVLESLGTPGASLMIFAMAPSPMDFKQQSLFGGEEGVLLDNMLSKVIGLNRQDCILSYVQKSLFRKRLLPRERNPLRLAFEQEIRLCRPRALLCLGASAAWELLQNGSPLEQMQAQDLYFAGTPLFVTYSLEEMLVEPSLRRNAMLALNRAKTFLQDGQAT